MPLYFDEYILLNLLLKKKEKKNVIKTSISFLILNVAVSYVLLDINFSFA